MPLPTEYKKILLAEDNERDVELILNALHEFCPAEVSVARDGVEALDYLTYSGKFKDRSWGHPSVIILDVKMPRLNGIEVLKTIKSKEEWRYIPVVMLTSSREERDLAECYRVGVNAYVVKPVDFTEFMESVKEIGLFWVKFNEQPP